MLQQIKALSEKYSLETIAHRHHLHKHPELSFNEFETANYVEQHLRYIGFTDIKRMAGTGVIALLKSTNTLGPVLALRADLDALPIRQISDKPYCSVNAGVMHACGHDAHTAILLSTAKILFELKEQITGNIKFIFQPGEELLPGGASLLIREGVLQHPHVDALLAQHVTPQIPTGKVGFKAGLFMASTDELYLTVKGKGGHAAMPETYHNPLLIASAIMTRLHSMFMLEKTEDAEQIPTVIAFGKIEGLGATNVIPDVVSIAGTFRTLHEPWRERAHRIIIDTATTVAKQMYGACEVEIKKGYPCLVNDEQITREAQRTTAQYLGKDSLIDLSHRMTAEDFAYFSQTRPVCFYRLGTGHEQKGTTTNVHNATFDIDEDVLYFAPGLMASMALDLLNHLATQKK